MQVFTNYPKTEEGKKLFLNNLALFKANLFLKCLDKLNIDEKDKGLVLEKAFEILKQKSDGAI